MKKLTLLTILIASVFMSCTENYSTGERIGFVTKFSTKGIIWKSWEGEMNVTQTGMNTSNLFEFSVDNNNEPVGVVAKLDSAANKGWKVKIIYHEVYGKNITRSRGETDHFVNDVIILDKTPMQSIFGNGTQDNKSEITGRTIDTIYVVIDRTK